MVADSQEELQTRSSLPQLETCIQCLSGIIIVFAILHHGHHYLTDVGDVQLSGQLWLVGDTWPSHMSWSSGGLSLS